MFQYLHASCPSEWPAALVGNLIVWPIDTVICEGSGGMKACLENYPGAIGYMDSSFGHNAGLTEIWLRNADGRYVSSMEPLGISSAAASVSLPTFADKDFSSVTFVNQSGEFTWPIVEVMYIYMFVRTCLTLEALELKVCW